MSDKPHLQTALDRPATRASDCVRMCAVCLRLRRCLPASVDICDGCCWFWLSWSCWLWGGSCCYCCCWSSHGCVAVVGASLVKVVRKLWCETREPRVRTETTCFSRGVRLRIPASPRGRRRTCMSSCCASGSARYPSWRTIASPSSPGELDVTTLSPSECLVCSSGLVCAVGGALWMPVES
eukprot:1153732-Amphidinium_carterae.1